MSEWKIIKQETIDAGANNFIEVTLKTPPENNNKLIAISKGWITNDKQKRYKSNILLSVDKKDELIKILSEIDRD